MNSKLYKQNIIDHYKNPRNSGKLSSPTHTASVANRSCGDEITLHLIIKDGEVVDVAFEVRGCAICTASMSMMSEKIKESNLSEISMIEPENVLSMIGMESSSGRVKCALLSLDAIREAIDV